MGNLLDRNIRMSMGVFAVSAVLWCMMAFVAVPEYGAAKVALASAPWLASTFVISMLVGEAKLACYNCGELRYLNTACRCMAREE